MQTSVLSLCIIISRILDVTYKHDDHNRISGSLADGDVLKSVNLPLLFLFSVFENATIVWRGNSGKIWLEQERIEVGLRISEE